MFGNGFFLPEAAYNIIVKLQYFDGKYKGYKLFKGVYMFINSLSDKTIDFQILLTKLISNDMFQINRDHLFSLPIIVVISH